MTGKFSLKAVCAALALAAAGSANAGLFFMNVGTNYGGVTDGKVNTTSTSVKNQMTFQYVSSTIFKDQDNNLGISVGDTTTTTAGLALPGALLGNNQITGFTPNQVNFPGTDSNNGYGNNWLISFGIENLKGTVSSIGTGPEITYGSGALLKMYIWDSASATNGLNFMNIKVTGGSSGTGGTFLDGEVDFTGITGNAFKNLFNTAAPNSCGGYTGFYDLWANCSAEPYLLKISFGGDFNTDARQLVTNPIGFDTDGKLLIKADNIKHDGSATFDIPEPGTLALAGLALVGLASARRRKA